MSSAKHEVTVYDSVASTAQVSVAQVEAYLRRTGWALVPVRNCGHVARHASGSCMGIRAIDSEERIGDIVSRVAEIEQRQPSAVLADIAREPVL